MSDQVSKTLLPEGLRDMLPPDAAIEAAAVDGLCRCFAANGYELVKPPLVEFEDALLSGVGAPMAERIFRMLDPVSHRTLGIRTDMTTQIARIAASRLAAAPRPLRLMYAGPVLRVRGSQLEPERQFTQAGIELIGAPSAAADAEAIIVTVEALTSLGVHGISVDLAVPTLVPSLMPSISDDLRSALDHKDTALIKAHGGQHAQTLAALVRASGAADAALDAVGKLELPATAKAEWTALVNVVSCVRAALPTLALTIDAVENRGFEYHTGITFSVFATGSQREIGRGGRYTLPSGEPATGATVLVDPILAAAPPPPAPKRILAGAGTDRDTVQRLQGEGWSVVIALNGAAPSKAEAQRMNCSHLFDGARAVAVS